jgi:hypothetical protein
MQVFFAFTDGVDKVGQDADDIIDFRFRYIASEKDAIENQEFRKWVKALPGWEARPWGITHGEMEARMSKGLSLEGFWVVTRKWGKNGG